ncbi:hypothetical protein HK405_002234, partial [Cladochytrium tenue]
TVAQARHGLTIIPMVSPLPAPNSKRRRWLPSTAITVAAFTAVLVAAIAPLPAHAQSVVSYGTCFKYGGFNQGDPEPLTSALCCANYPFVGIVQACTSSSSCTYTCYCYRAVADVSLGEAPAADCGSCSPSAFSQVSKCGVSGPGMELYNVDWTVSASTSTAAAAANLPTSVT